MEEIKKFSHTIYNKLGTGYKENIYAAAMQIELINAKYKFSSETIVPIMYENIQIGWERADIVIYEPIKCILEFKAINTSLNKKESLQLKKYLMNMNIDNGLLINFGNSLEIKEVNKLIELT